MARAVLREVVVGLALTSLLLGCVDGGGKSGDSGGVLAAPGKKAGAQDIEAPEVFQATDSALWDGRPSLGGIWVASPDVQNPERALLFNPATGRSVTGALFKRERDNPGPRLQLSSDAAEALGILAGQPTEIKVTALRKKEVEAATETGAEAEAAAETAPAAAAGDAAAIASAALDAVDSKATTADPAATGDGKSNEAATAAVAAGTAAVVADGATDAASAVVDETPKRKTWKERRAEAKAAREAKKKAAADAKAAAAAAAAGTAVAVEGEAPTTTPDAASAAMAPIEAAPLDARNSDVAAVKKTEPAGSKKPAAVAAEPAAEPPAPAATGPARPIQVASFSKEANATRAAEALAKIGITATPQKSEKGGKAVWGVVVMGDEATLKKIKDAGFADAYFLK